MSNFNNDEMSEMSRDWLREEGFSEEVIDFLLANIHDHEGLKQKLIAMVEVLRGFHKDIKELSPDKIINDSKGDLVCLLACIAFQMED